MKYPILAKVRSGGVTTEHTFAASTPEHASRVLLALAKEGTLLSFSLNIRHPFTQVKP